MVVNKCAMCLICLASLVALSWQDLYSQQKRTELVQETFLPDHQFINRNARQNKFWSGSRYGRAGNVGPQPRLEIEPRGDRFFMGSRYGKRSTVGAFPGKIRVRSQRTVRTNPYNLPTSPTLFQRLLALWLQGRSYSNANV